MGVPSGPVEAAGVMPTVPLVSIGMPVFNGEKVIKNALDSLLGQSFPDFELIISDNASTDGTERICREYAARDRRIRYVRQPHNIGATANYKFVLDEAGGEFFMWAASDDVRSPDFIELNARFLSEHPEYVASTSPNGFEGTGLESQNLEHFAMEGEGRFERFMEFFRNCWVSHGIFYCLVRTEILRECTVIGQSFIAADWTIDLYLASRGKVHRTEQGYAVFGIKGVSRRADAYKVFRNNAIEVLLPFYRLSKYMMTLAAGLTLTQKATIALILLRLNASAALHPLRVRLQPVRRSMRKDA
jgi:glycosyltransferase involved in cell wall biosynthesis